MGLEVLLRCLLAVEEEARIDNLIIKVARMLNCAECKMRNLTRR